MICIWLFHGHIGLFVRWIALLVWRYIHPQNSLDPWLPSRHFYRWFVTCIYIHVYTHEAECRGHDSFMCVTRLIHVCDMTHLYVSCDGSYEWHVSSMYVWYDAFMRVIWLIHVCDVTHAYEWHDSFACVTWLIHMCGMNHSYVWHDSFICVTWLIHMCDMTHPYSWSRVHVCM